MLTGPWYRSVYNCGPSRDGDQRNLAPKASPHNGDRPSLDGTLDSRPASCTHSALCHKAAKDPSSSWQVMRFLPGRILVRTLAHTSSSLLQYPPGFTGTLEARRGTPRQSHIRCFPVPSAYPLTPQGHMAGIPRIQFAKTRINMGWGSGQGWLNINDQNGTASGHNCLTYTSGAL